MDYQNYQLSEEDLALKKKLRDQIAAKIAEQDRALDYEATRGDRIGAAYDDSNSTNSLLDLLNRSAAQIGTIGGRTADTSALSDQTKQLAEISNKREGRQQQGDEHKQKLHEYLMTKLGDQQKLINDKEVQGLKLKQTAEEKANDRAWEEKRDASKFAQQNKLDASKDNRALSMEQMKINAAKDLASIKDSEKHPTDYAGKVAKLPAAEKQRLDNLTMGINSVHDMADALAGGENTFSVIGDNSFTVAERNFAEAIGRMQSGGAINKDEENRFLQMAPKFKDSVPIRESKLKKIRTMLEDRLTTLGLSSKEIPGVHTPDQLTSLVKKPDDTATAAPADKPDVIQNGHTYKWNSKTGQYE